ncbi:hypothetical protein GSI_14491 [Ganoderma sinense ZZ0214-1]|uniref:Uncharacterized protein n=1 Tax=Ganoderma sinense ZZ0214-1 TaxID=1077348 RepID=A0A2G8RNT8_9APHY|nr:hypothetical protein GSI_14491 [Ganoderma sinense ZZ0214-1]
MPFSRYQALMEGPLSDTTPFPYPSHNSQCMSVQSPTVLTAAQVSFATTPAPAIGPSTPPVELNNSRARTRLPVAR